MNRVLKNYKSKTANNSSLDSVLTTTKKKTMKAITMKEKQHMNLHFKKLNSNVTLLPVPKTILKHHLFVVRRFSCRAVVLTGKYSQPVMNKYLLILLALHDKNTVCFAIVYEPWQLVGTT